jgi:hypothetical protein
MTSSFMSDVSSSDRVSPSLGRGDVEGLSASLHRGMSFDGSLNSVEPSSSFSASRSRAVANLIRQDKALALRDLKLAQQITKVEFLGFLEVFPLKQDVLSLAISKLEHSADLRGLKLALRAKENQLLMAADANWDKAVAEAVTKTEQDEITMKLKIRQNHIRKIYDELDEKLSSLWRLDEKHPEKWRPMARSSGHL